MCDIRWLKKNSWGTLLARFWQPWPRAHSSFLLSPLWATAARWSSSCPVCSRIYLGENSSCFFLKWNVSQRWAQACELRGRRKVCNERGSEFSGYFFQTDSQHRPAVQRPPRSPSSLGADTGPHKPILTALLSTTSGPKQRQWLLLLPPSLGNITHSPLSPALMHTQR